MFEFLVIPAIASIFETLRATNQINNTLNNPAPYKVDGDLLVSVVIITYKMDKIDKSWKPLFDNYYFNIAELYASEKDGIEIHNPFRYGATC